MNPLMKITSALLVILSLIYCGWYFSNQEAFVLLNNEELSMSVDASATELSLKQFDADGRLINALTSPYMEHIPKEDIHWFHKPHIIVSQDDEPAWDITSIKAKSIAGGKSIVFMKEVVVHQNSGSKTPESTLKTEQITYYPDLKKATTKHLVTFEQPGNSIQSTGMNAYLDEKRVELLHRAKGIYDPKNG